MKTILKKGYIAAILLIALIVGITIWYDITYCYDSNNGFWKQDYEEDLVNKYGILTIDEMEQLKEDKYITYKDTVKILEKLWEYKNNDKNDYLSSINYNKETNISRYEFADLLSHTIDKNSMLVINDFRNEEIIDVSTNNEFYNEVYLVCEYGLMPLSDDNSFNGDEYVTTDEAIKYFNFYLNPNLRYTFRDYENEYVQSESFPMEYENDNTGVEITITKERYFGTTCYVAHVLMDNPSHLKTIYSDFEWSYIGCEASTIDKRINSIFLINGDFKNRDYGKKYGIIRNREIINEKTVNALTLDIDGNFDYIEEGDVFTLLDNGVRETWSFGPVLVNNGLKVDSDKEEKHPRTFMGQIYRNDNTLEYYFIVANGRRLWEEGLTNSEMSEILLDKGCDFGYNLDGGGSSIMMFDGKVINQPSDWRERPDTDYLYIK